MIKFLAGAFVQKVVDRPPRLIVKLAFSSLHFQDEYDKFRNCGVVFEVEGIKMSCLKLNTTWKSRMATWKQTENLLLSKPDSST
jgi:hypothetical protein